MAHQEQHGQYSCRQNEDVDEPIIFVPQPSDQAHLRSWETATLTTPKDVQQPFSFSPLVYPTLSTSRCDDSFADMQRPRDTDRNTTHHAAERPVYSGQKDWAMAQHAGW
ncbi:uncharacterized protein FFMR_15859 [Fusarium fujikuroi]|uniref:Uncharacterized protein n=1 Tax=Fusarium fujikuroi TaxID=5127 RepID=A0A9Q9RFP9_FUSFU|nr:uncharacterized protein FFE2_15885 [Fusarium fujikuroi]SCO53950.1 uncharacterized protein FFNC_15271 [Fusarium fujikuroi]SCO58703.1 uncharacterized protein FFMR_15859 [Fusarium fujikuroi]VTT60894.1 unnamed protein product [Fusarium fujikuroi]VTT73185.1 unnamed protein product [Fusarium fujikuroi]